MQSWLYLSQKQKEELQERKSPADSKAILTKLQSHDERKIPHAECKVKEVVSQSQQENSDKNHQLETMAMQIYSSANLDIDNYCRVHRRQLYRDYLTKTFGSDVRLPADSKFPTAVRYNHRRQFYSNFERYLIYFKLYELREMYSNEVNKLVISEVDKIELLRLIYEEVGKRPGKIYGSKKIFKSVSATCYAAIPDFLTLKEASIYSLNPVVYGKYSQVQNLLYVLIDAAYEVLSVCSESDLAKSFEQVSLLASGEFDDVFIHAASDAQRLLAINKLYDNYVNYIYFMVDQLSESLNSISDENLKSELNKILNLLNISLENAMFSVKNSDKQSCSERMQNKHS